MRKLNTSAITTAVAMPVKSGSLDHIQLAYTEAIREVAQSVIGPGYSGATVYILSGLVNGSTHPTYNISAGSVFFNGEVYLVDAANFTLAGGQVAVCKIVTTQFTGPNADGVVFNDGVSRNVHDIRKVQVVADLGGSGIANFVDLQRINSNQPNVSITSGSGISVGGGFPNFTVTNTSPSDPEIIGKGDIPIGDLNSSADLDSFTTMLAGSSNNISAYRYTFPVALPVGTNYQVVLMVNNFGYSTTTGFAFNAQLSCQVGTYDHLGFYFAISTPLTSTTQAITVRYLLVKV